MKDELDVYTIMALLIIESGKKTEQQRGTFPPDRI
jgi:hypothetical protein